MRSTRKTAVAAGTMAAAAIAATALGAGSAAAANGATSTTVYTLASSGFCAGQLSASVANYPDQADLAASGTLIGAGPCSLDVDFVFTSRADGHVAKFTRHFSGPGTIGLGGRDIVSPGKPGVYDVRVTPRAQYVGGQKLTIDTVYRG